MILTKGKKVSQFYFNVKGTTISELELLNCFIAFSWTFPMMASAHNARDIRVTPWIKKKKVTNIYQLLKVVCDIIPLRMFFFFQILSHS